MTQPLITSQVMYYSITDNALLKSTAMETPPLCHTLRAKDENVKERNFGFGHA
jgi:hypothetical protein